MHCLTVATRTFDPTLGNRNIPQIFFWGGGVVIFYFLNENWEKHMWKNTNTRLIK